MNNVMVHKLCNVIGQKVSLLLVELLFNIGDVILENMEYRLLSTEVIAELFVIFTFDYITLFEK